MNICGVVVFFNPSDSCISNIDSYIDHLDKIIIVDNSINDNMNLFENKDFSYMKKIQYIPLYDNKGLAVALNVGCRKAAQLDYEYVLTMDQDSYFDSGALQKMMNFAKNDVEKKYAIVSPNVRSLYYDGLEEKEAYIQFDTDKNTIKNRTMTSGSLMHLNSFIEIGGFDEKMFIAHLDIDLGIKIHEINKSIIVIHDSILNQHFGNSKPKKILWKTVHPSYANPVRTYYLFRNQKYLENKYGKDAKKYIGVSLWKFFIKITLFEDRKREKYKMMMRGIRDSKKQVMGKYDEGRYK